MFNSHWQQLYKTLGFAKLTSNFNQCFFFKMDVSFVQGHLKNETKPGDKLLLSISAHRQWLDVQDHEVKRHGQADGANQPHVPPGGHAEEGLVLGHAENSES